ncbi:hypothetical protein [Plantactinospora veratri]
MPADWDGNGTVTPGITENFENRVRRWYVKHTLAGGVGDAYFDYGDDAPYPF